MKFLHWYSAVIIAWSLTALTIPVIAGTSSDIETDLYAIALYIPIQVFLVLGLIKNKKDEQK